MDLLLYVVLGVLLLASSFAATLVYNHKHHHPEIVVVDSREGHVITGPRVPPGGTRKPTPSMSREEREALEAGRTDVVGGWISWAKYVTDAERSRADKDKYGYGRPTPFYNAVSPANDRSHEAPQQVMAQVPTSQWTLGDLQHYLRDLTIYGAITAKKDTPPELIVPKADIQARKKFTAALVTDLVTETYNPTTAPITAEHAYHVDRQIQARYIEGRSKGTEEIIDAVTASRTRTREIGQASEAIAAAGDLQAAALRALRETNQTTAAVDQHKDYDEQFKALEGPTEQ